MYQLLTDYAQKGLSVQKQKYRRHIKSCHLYKCCGYAKSGGFAAAGMQGRLLEGALKEGFGGQVGFGQAEQGSGEGKLKRGRNGEQRLRGRNLGQVYREMCTLTEIHLNKSCIFECHVCCHWLNSNEYNQDLNSGTHLKKQRLAGFCSLRKDFHEVKFSFGRLSHVRLRGLLSRRSDEMPGTGL